MRSERKQGLAAEYVPVSAYDGISKNIKDLKDLKDLKGYLAHKKPPTP